MFLFIIFNLLLCLLSKCAFSAAAWERVPLEELSKAERKHISDAWLVSPDRRHVDFLLDDRRLHELSFIMNLTEARRRRLEKTLSKKSKPPIINNIGIFYTSSCVMICSYRYLNNNTELSVFILSSIRETH